MTTKKFKKDNQTNNDSSEIKTEPNQNQIKPKTKPNKILVLLLFKKNGMHKNYTFRPIQFSSVGHKFSYALFRRSRHFDLI